MWDRRNADDAASRKNKSIIWQGNIDREEFEKIALRFIKKYFSHPSYYKIDDKPVFMLYDLLNFIEGMGGVEQTRDALEWFRKQVQKAGFKGLELQLSMRRESPNSLKFAGKEIGNQKFLVEQLGFNSLTHYQFVHFVEVDKRDYTDVVPEVVSIWEKISEKYKAAYYPQVSVGWDNTPRTIKHIGKILENNTPENFKKALMEAKKFVDARPNQAPLITINSWNEWTETSYLQPCSMYGYGYLQAVKKVFIDEEK
jgi:hypothetical protein